MTFYVLPHLSANGAQFLARNLLLVSEGRALPPAVGEGRHMIETALEGLVLAQRDRLATTSVEVAPAMAANANAWAALDEHLTAWARLPSGGVAKELSTAVFPGGREFVKLDGRASWAQGELRLALLLRERGGDVAATGSQPFVAHVQECHAALGMALGIGETHAKAARVSEKLGALRDALETYALALHVHARRPIEGATELAAELLAPVEAAREVARLRRRSSNEGKVDDAPSTHEAPGVVAEPEEPGLGTD